MNKQSLLLKILLFPITRIILGGSALMGISLGLKRFVFSSLPGLLGFKGDLAKSLEYLLSIIGIFVVYTLVFRLYEGRKIKELSGKHFLGESLLGFWGGFSCISLVLLILQTVGNFHILSIYPLSNLMIPITAIALFALIEEILFRGILYRITEENLGTIIALILTSLPFGIFHIFNKDANFFSILSATLGGLLLGILFSLTKRLWLPIFVHVGWNFAQVFFLSNVSSVTDYTGLFESRLEGSKLLIGGGFGIEDSLISSSLLILITGALFYSAWKKGRLEKPFWKRSSEEELGNRLESVS